MINKTGKTTTFSNHTAIFELRNNRQQHAVFPFVDSSGTEVLSDRRVSPSTYLQRIKVEELLLQEKEFKEIFDK